LAATAQEAVEGIEVIDAMINAEPTGEGNGRGEGGRIEERIDVAAVAVGDGNGDGGGETKEDRDDVSVGGPGVPVEDSERDSERRLQGEGGGGATRRPAPGRHEEGGGGRAGGGELDLSSDLLNKCAGRGLAPRKRTVAVATAAGERCGRRKTLLSAALFVPPVSSRARVISDLEAFPRSDIDLVIYGLRADQIMDKVRRAVKTICIMRCSSYHLHLTMKGLTYNFFPTHIYQVREIHGAVVAAHRGVEAFCPEIDCDDSDVVFRTQNAVTMFFGWPSRYATNQSI
jgi:hypothetical protein